MKHAAPLGVILAAVVALLSPATAAPSLAIAHRKPGPLLVVYVDGAAYVQASTVTGGAFTSWSVPLNPAICYARRASRYRCELPVHVGSLYKVKACDAGTPVSCTDWLTEPDVRCLNNNGQGCVDTIMVRAADPPAVIPASPTNVSAAAWFNNLTVNWQGVWNASSYRISTSTDGYTWTTQATVPASASWAWLLKLQPTTTYQVKVQSVNAAGTSP
jgi:hypothetical protein